MKKIFFLIIIHSITNFFIANGQCDCEANIGVSSIFMKDFIVELNSNTPETTKEFTLLLNKDTRYRFSSCNGGTSKTEIILELYDKDKILLTNNMGKMHEIHEIIDFICKKTAVYRLVFSIKNGKTGCGKGVLSLVN